MMGKSSEFNGTEPCEQWYRDIKDYDFTTGGRKPTSHPNAIVGHATALVWDNATKVGFGFAFKEENCNGSVEKICYTVARYTPAPNWIGQ